GIEAWLASASLLSASSSPRSATLDSGARSATLDSGASHSMCGDASLFANLRRCKPSSVGGIGGNANALIATGVGSLSLRLRSGRFVVVRNALLVKGLKTVLLSSGQLWDLHGVASHFAEHATLTRNGAVIATGTRTKGSLYLLDPRPKSGQVTGLRVEGAHRSEECNVCRATRATRLPFPSSDSLASHPLELVHSDVLTVDTASLAGKRYVVTFVDDFSRRLWVEPLDRKSGAFEAFKRFKAAAETESSCKLQRFWSDNGGEYSSRAFRAYFDEHGVAFESPPPYSPASNGVAERVNRSILEGIYAMLHQAGTDKSLWAEALLAFGKVPLSVWRDHPVRVDMLRVWGCVPYRLLDPASKRIVRSRNARFQEDLFPLASPSSPAAAAIVPDPPVAIADNGPIQLTVNRIDAAPIGLLTPAPAPPATPAAPARVPAPHLFVTPPPQPVFQREAAPSPESPNPLDFLSDLFVAQPIGQTRRQEGTHWP
ncbi:hypothetical protein JCM1840_007050, partial [Sporobolomyces johnsonii]